MAMMDIWKINGAAACLLCEQGK